MNCWSCRRKSQPPQSSVPIARLRCKRNPPQAKRLPSGIALTSMDPDVMSELRRRLHAEYQRRGIDQSNMVGDCPQCGSSNTQNCENDPEIEDAYAAQARKLMVLSVRRAAHG